MRFFQQLVFILHLVLVSSVLHAAGLDASAASSGNKIKAENLFIGARESEKNGDLLAASNAFLKSFLEYPHPSIMYEHIRLAYLAEQYQLVQNTGLKFLGTKPDISKRLSQNILDMVASSQELLQYELNLVDEKKLNAPSNDGAKKPKMIRPYRIHTNIFDIERSKQLVTHSTMATSQQKPEANEAQDHQSKIFERHNASIVRTVNRLAKANPDSVNRYNVGQIAAKGSGKGAEKGAELQLLSKDKNGFWQLRKENELKPMKLELLDDSKNGAKGKPHVFLIGDEAREHIFSIDLKKKEIRHMNQITREKQRYKILGFE